MTRDDYNQSIIEIYRKSDLSVQERMEKLMHVQTELLLYAVEELQKLNGPVQPTPAKPVVNPPR
jgi:hypothetical protein